MATVAELREQRAIHVEETRTFYDELNDGNSTAEDQGVLARMTARFEILNQQIRVAEDEARDAEIANQADEIGSDGANALDYFADVERFAPANSVATVGRDSGGVSRLKNEMLDASKIPKDSKEYVEAFKKWLDDPKTKDPGVWNILEEVSNSLAIGDSHGSDVLAAPMQMSAGIIETCDALLQIRQRSTIFSMTNIQSLGIRKETTKLDAAAWGGRCVAPTPDESDLELRVLDPQYISACSGICRDLQRRTTINMGAYLSRRLGRNIADKMEEAYWTGSGTKRPLGVFTTDVPGALSAAQDYTTATVGALIADDLVNAHMALPQCVRQAAGANLAWAFSTDVLSQIMLMKDGQGQYIWRPFIRDGYPSTLLGHGVIESTFIPNVVASGKYIGAIADWSGYYIADGIRVLIERDVQVPTDHEYWYARAYTDGMPVVEENFKRILVKS